MRKDRTLSPRFSMFFGLAFALPQADFSLAKESPTTEQVLEEQALSELSDTSIKRLNSVFIREYVQRADALSKTLREMAKQADKVKQVTEDLLDNDKGRVLGKRVEVVRAFMAFEQFPIVTSKEIDKRLTRVEPIRQGIIEYASVPKLFKPSKIPEIKKLAAEESWASEKAREIDNRKEKIRALMKLAPKGVAATGEPTLRQRVEAVTAKMIQDEIKTVGDAREEGRLQAIAGTAEAAKIRELELGKQKTENELRLMKLELEKAQADFKLLEAKKLAVLQEMEQAVQSKNLRTKLEDTKVLKKLRPFMAKGYWQPGATSRAASLKKGPISFSALEQFGALNSGHQGLARLLAVANGSGMGNHVNSGTRFSIPRTYTGTYRHRKHIDTDRPKWSYPKDFQKLTAEQLVEVAEVQDLLIELGPTMVEEGMLAP